MDRAPRHKRRNGFIADVIDDERVTGIKQAVGHGAAHFSGADKAERIRHGLPRGFQ